MAVFGVARKKFCVDLIEGVKEVEPAPRDAPMTGALNIDLDKLTREPLTENEVYRLNARVRLKMVTTGYRDNERGHEKLLQDVKTFLREIDKSNEGYRFHPGMGWIKLS